MRYLVQILFFGVFWCYAFSGKAQKNNQDEPKVKLTGSLTAEMSTYSTSRDFQHYDPFAFRIYSNSKLSTKKWDLPFNFILTSQKNILSQSINKFGISPTYNKWLRFHLGHRRVNFSSMTLGGKSFLGAGVEMQAKKLRLGAVYGRFNRAIRIDSIDYQFSSYDRSGYAAKIGIGSRFNFVDLIYFRASDDDETGVYSSNGKTIAPAENAITAINIKQRFFKKIYFELEGALSIYNHDKNGELVDTDHPLVQYIEYIMPVRNTNQYLTGLKSKLQYRSNYFSLGAEYLRIEPDFRSMGTYYIRDDIERISGFTRFMTKNRKLTGLVKIGRQRNNILDNKVSNRSQQVNNFSLTYTPSRKLTLSADYSNFITRQVLELAGLEDSTLLDQHFNNYNIMGSYRINSNEKQHLIRIQGGMQQTTNLNSNRNFGSYNARIYYRLTNINNGLSFQPQMVFNRYTIFDAVTNRYSPGMLLDWNITEKIKVSINSTYAFEQKNEVRQSTVFRNLFTAEYQFNQKQFISLRVIHSNSRYTSLSLANGTIFRTELRYGIRF